jgi:hypothetical protein
MAWCMEYVSHCKLVQLYKPSTSLYHGAVKHDLVITDLIKHVVANNVERQTKPTTSTATLPPGPFMYMPPYFEWYSEP